MTPTQEKLTKIESVIRECNPELLNYMNQLTQLIEEQEKAILSVLDIEFPNVERWKYDSYAKVFADWHTSSIKATLQAQVEMLEKELEFSPVTDYCEGMNHALQTQINLLTETINSMK